MIQSKVKRRCQLKYKMMEQALQNQSIEEQELDEMLKQTFLEEISTSEEFSEQFSGYFFNNREGEEKDTEREIELISDLWEETKNLNKNFGLETQI